MPGCLSVDWDLSKGAEVNENKKRKEKKSNSLIMSPTANSEGTVPVVTTFYFVVKQVRVNRGLEASLIFAVERLLPFPSILDATPWPASWCRSCCLTSFSGDNLAMLNIPAFYFLLNRTRTRRQRRSWTIRGAARLGNCQGESSLWR